MVSDTPEGSEEGCARASGTPMQRHSCGHRSGAARSTLTTRVRPHGTHRVSGVLARGRPTRGAPRSHRARPRRQGGKSPGRSHAQPRRVEALGDRAHPTGAREHRGDGRRAGRPADPERRPHHRPRVLGVHHQLAQQRALHRGHGRIDGVPAALRHPGLQRHRGAIAGVARRGVRDAAPHEGPVLQRWVERQPRGDGRGAPARLRGAGARPVGRWRGGSAVRALCVVRDSPHHPARRGGSRHGPGQRSGGADRPRAADDPRGAGGRDRR